MAQRTPQGCLIQQHGYFVLRFLASDVVKRLDAVLDSIYVVMAGRSRL